MMDMGKQYGLPDHRHLLAGKTHFPLPSDASGPFPGHRSLINAHPHYGIVVPGGGSELFLSSPNLPPTLPPPPPPTGMDAFGFLEEGGGGGGGVSQGRWPRQETLTLLEIRTRLHPKFKEASQKAPLWDEVSRIMAEEHGYQRSGKKCREKLENLYKYYKKTKEGKAGRQDGKHYRFFRQLEALYGENSNPTSATQEPLEVFQPHRFWEKLSFSDSTELDTTSTDDEEDGDDDDRSTKRSRKGWAKIREFAEMQMRRCMEIQEAWLDKMLMRLENMEQGRICREDAWREQEAARWDREHRFWASERAWIEARDAALIEALDKISRRKSKTLSVQELTSVDLDEDSDNNWGEIKSEMPNGNSEITTDLIKLRNSAETKYQEGGCSSGAPWEEISAEMSCFCGAKRYFRRTMGCNKKQKVNDEHLESLYRQGSAGDCYEDDGRAPDTVGLRPSPSISNGCFQFLMSGGESLWEDDAMPAHGADL